MIHVAITDDDVSVGKADELLKVHDFHMQFGIPVSYFIIPFPGWTEQTISQDAELMNALGRIRADGSEAHPHSHRHHPFEWGYPEISGAMEFSQELCKCFADDRFQVELFQQKAHMLGRMQEVLDEWERFSGERAEGFRPGWGSFSGTLYEVMEACGFKWSSLRFASRSSWHRCKGFPSEDVINERVGLMPYRQNGLIEFPILGDFGFHTTRSEGPALIRLFKEQFEACQQAGAPAVICHHPHGLDSEDVEPGSGYEIYADIFRWLLDQEDVRFVTMSQLYDAWKDKELAELKPTCDPKRLDVKF